MDPHVEDATFAAVKSDGRCERGVDEPRLVRIHPDGDSSGGVVEKREPEVDLRRVLRRFVVELGENIE